MGNATQQKIIGFFDPYLDTLGGGEQYVFSIAQYFHETMPDSHLIFFWKSQEILKKIQQRYSFIPPIHIENLPKTFTERIKSLNQCEYFFYVTDGSLMYSAAKHNMLIIQSPAHIPAATVKNKLKLHFWEKILCYSGFVKKFISAKIDKPIYVLPPSVQTDHLVASTKEKYILSVGRFFPHLHSKKQDVLIAAFKKLINSSNLANWRLILAGSVLGDADQRYLIQLQKAAAGYPIEFRINQPYEKIIELYAHASIFWLGTGFGADLVSHPEYAEHFGIVSIEAMASQAIPIVFNGGGQKEIVTDQHDGFLFNDETELIETTLRLIRDDNLRNTMGKNALQTSQKFNKNAFHHNLTEVLKDKRHG